MLKNCSDNRFKLRFDLFQFISGLTLIIFSLILTGCEVTIKTREYSKDKVTKKQHSQSQHQKDSKSSKSSKKTSNKSVNKSAKKKQNGKSSSLLAKLGLESILGNEKSKKNSDQNIKKITWTWPVKTTRDNPISLKKTTEGMLFIGKPNTPVLASAKGTVMYSGNSLEGYGNLIIIKHSDDILSVYAQNKKILAKEGEKVVPGQVIAEIDKTGKMLFEIRQAGKALDPLKVLPNRMK